LKKLPKGKTNTRKNPGAHPFRKKTPCGREGPKLVKETPPKRLGKKRGEQDALYIKLCRGNGSGNS